MLESTHINTSLYFPISFPLRAGLPTGMILGMDLGSARKRLRSWFCKSAALILSPFDETLVSDPLSFTHSDFPLMYSYE